MEAYLQTGQVDLAVEINNSLTSADPIETAGLCNLLKRTAANPTISADDNDKIIDMLTFHKCQDN